MHTSGVSSSVEPATIPDIAAIVGRNIRSARLAAGLTQGALADRIGATSLMAVSRWETGTHKPGDAFLLALGRELGRDFAWFYTDHSARDEQAAA